MGPTVVWQLTQKCDLDCRNCVITAEGSRRGMDELSTFEAYKTIDQIAAIKPKHFTISGGDPLARRDIFQLVEYACRRRLDPEIAISPTRNLTRQNLDVLRRIGLKRVAFSVNGSTADGHDAVHATAGTFASTLQAVRWAHDSGMTMEINTLVTRRTMTDLTAIAELIEPFEIEAWNLYFLVPIAGSRTLEIINAEEAERVIAAAADHAAMAGFYIRTVEAPQYRRVLLQRQTPAGDTGPWSDFTGYIAGGDPLGAAVDDIVFITSRGEVRPSEFLPISDGNLRYRSLAAIVRGGDIFTALRTRTNLKGKCGRCEFREPCGGSRARAWAVTGDLFGSDPLCPYQPRAMEVSA